MRYLFIVIIASVAALSSLITLQYTNGVTVEYGYILGYDERYITLCNGSWENVCKGYDVLTFKMNNPGVPIVEGRGVQILDCRYSTTCSLYREYKAVPVLKSE